MSRWIVLLFILFTFNGFLESAKTCENLVQDSECKSYVKEGLCDEELANSKTVSFYCAQSCGLCKVKTKEPKILNYSITRDQGPLNILISILKKRIMQEEEEEEEEDDEISSDRLLNILRNINQHLRFRE